MNIIILLVHLVTMRSALSSYEKLAGRVHKGVKDTKNKYPFVVRIIYKVQFHCSGSAIAPQWELTAAHCVKNGQQYIQFGDYNNVPKCKYKVLEAIRHPRYIGGTICEICHTINDIALMQTTPLELQHFGTLLSVDYRALSGIAVEYGGYGSTGFKYDPKKDFPHKLQLGYGVLTSCDDTEGAADATKVGRLCVYSKCLERKQVTLGGDSGSPVFVDGKIAGVLHGSREYLALSMYTAVSPHLPWIYNEIKAKSF